MSLSDLIFPKKCLGCGREGRYLCSNCVGKSKKVKPICPYCERASIDGMTHTKCKCKFGLDGLVSIWEYEGVIRKAILALKYKYATEVAKDLAQVFIETLPHSSLFIIPNSSVLVPIPLHWYRENFRGFNQSEEIGKFIAKEMGWKFLPNLLVRKRLTNPQTELKAEDRLRNIKGVFSLNSHQSLAISHQPLILFDDVWTTGSTMREATNLLKKEGAKRVWGLTIAR